MFNLPRSLGKRLTVAASFTASSINRPHLSVCRLDHEHIAAILSLGNGTCPSAISVAFVFQTPGHFERLLQIRKGDGCIAG